MLFSSQKYYSISAYIFNLCCFQAKRTIVYWLTLLILQHKYGHENIVIWALFLSKIAVFVWYTRFRTKIAILYLLIFYIFVVLQARFTTVYPLTLSICHVIQSWKLPLFCNFVFFKTKLKYTICLYFFVI